MELKYAASRLATQAASLNRKLYASLPWGYRVAQMIYQIASAGSDVSPATFEALGRLVAAQFISADVQELPDIKGRPAASYKELVAGPRGADRLPRGYGQEYGKKIYLEALRKFKLPDIVDAGMAKFFENVLRGKINVNPGLPVHSALKFVTFVFMNLCRDAFQQYKHQIGSGGSRTCPECGFSSKRNLQGAKFVCQQCGFTKDLGGEVSMPTDSEGVELDLESPGTWRFLDSKLPEHTLRRLLDDLSKIHPKAAEWIEAKMEGLPDKELADRWGLTPSRISQLRSQWLPAIRDVFEDYDISVD